MTNEEQKTLGDILGFLTLPLLVLLDGYVIMRVWTWHVTPVFGVPLLTLGHAIGLDVLLMYAKYTNAPRDKTDERSILNMAVARAFSSGCFLLIAWCAR